MLSDVRWAPRRVQQAGWNRLSWLGTFSKRVPAVAATEALSLAARLADAAQQRAGVSAWTAYSCAPLIGVLVAFEPHRGGYAGVLEHAVPHARTHGRTRLGHRAGRLAHRAQHDFGRTEHAD